MSKPRTHRNRTTTNKHENKNQSQSQPQKKYKQPSWAMLRGLFTCKNVQVQQQQKKPQPEKEQHARQNKEQKKPQQEKRDPKENIKKCKKMNCSGSFCNITKVMARPETGILDVHKKRVSLSHNGASNYNNDASTRSMQPPQQEINGLVSASSSFSSLSAYSNSSLSGSFRGMPSRRLCGCDECRMVVDPVLGFTKDPSLRGTICSFPQCGEIFMKAEKLEHHQVIKHAVSELGQEDSSRNIVEIIFHSSWLKKNSPMCKIDRILKVHNSQRTICKFEEYRDYIKAKAAKLTEKHPRCIADGNELLRFYCTTYVCPLGLGGSSNLCNSTTQCNVCSIIKSGFKATGESNGGKGILTTATSGRAHDKSGVESNDKRAMLVCRVIAGRVKKNNNSVEGGGGSIVEEYDSVAGDVVGVYSNLDELYVFNHRAILPCFVVIYTL